MKYGKGGSGKKKTMSVYSAKKKAGQMVPKAGPVSAMAKAAVKKKGAPEGPKKSTPRTFVRKKMK